MVSAPFSGLAASSPSDAAAATSNAAAATSNAAAATSNAAAATRCAARARPGWSALWRALDEVADPEIPVVSVLGLGMVRALAWDDEDPSALVVHLTPTYCGCPATAVIIDSVRHALLAVGAPAVRVELRLAPAWTTAWLTPRAQEALKAYGIAAPGTAVPAARGNAPAVVDVRGMGPLRRPQAVVACPRCGSTHTRLVAQFGSTACKAHYTCVDCLEPFDHFKPHG